MESNSANSIALLIDADNSPAAKIDFIMSELSSYGVVNIRRAYGNWKKPSLKGWEAVLLENSIQPMQTFDLVPGKNATDMTLAIDAMDILYTKQVSIFCLVSSDCDFTPLSQRLRADGKQVIGVGGKKTPMSFANSCTRFLYLDDKPQVKPPTQEVTSPPVPVEVPQDLRGNTKLMSTLLSAVKESEDKDGWALLGPVGSRIANAGPFDHRTYGYKKLRDLFAGIDGFEVADKDGHPVVRIVQKGNGESKRKGGKAG